MRWTIYYAEDFSGVSQTQIRRLIQKGVLKPEKHGRAHNFGYTDIYVLRVFKILQRQGLEHLDISQA